MEQGILHGVICLIRMTILFLFHFVLCSKGWFGEAFLRAGEQARHVAARDAIARHASASHRRCRLHLRPRGGQVKIHSHSLVCSVLFGSEWDAPGNGRARPRVLWRGDSDRLVDASDRRRCVDIWGEIFVWLAYLLSSCWQLNLWGSIRLSRARS